MSEKARLLPALGAGFSLVRRDPLAVLAWGLVYLAISILPLLLFIPLMGAGVIEAYRDAASGGGGGTPSAQSLVAYGWLIQLLQMVTGLVAAALVYSAIYRAVLRPGERGFAYLRMSSEELNLGVVIVVLFVLMIVGFIVGAIALAIPMGILVAIGSLAGDAGAALGGLLALVVSVAAFVGALIPATRFGMALPMTIAERRIVVFEAWTFTKGYSWRLVGLALMQVLVMIAIYVVIILVALIFVVGGGIAGGLAGLENLTPASIAAIMPFVVILGLLYLAITFVLLPIFVAPWARAYELIAAARGEDNNTVFD